MKTLPRLVVVACAVTAALLTASGTGAANDACKPSGTLVGTTIHYCGPATARLSIFPGVTFKGGTCSTTPDGTVTFKLHIGTRTQDERHNSGRPYFAITVTGPLSRPTGGGVIAYWQGKRWGGAGTAFNGGHAGGSFTARGIKDSRGNATGSYKC
jgi:hypothetical protein